MIIDQNTLLQRFGYYSDAVVYKAVHTDHFMPVLLAETSAGTGYHFSNFHKKLPCLIHKVAPSDKLIKLSDTPYNPKVYTEEQLEFMSAFEDAEGVTLDFLHYLSVGEDRCTFVVSKDTFHRLMVESGEMLAKYEYKTIYAKKLTRGIDPSTLYAVSFFNVDNVVPYVKHDIFDSFCLAFEVFHVKRATSGNTLIPEGYYYIASKTGGGIFFVDGLDHISLNGCDPISDNSYLKSITYNEVLKVPVTKKNSKPYMDGHQIPIDFFDDEPIQEFIVKKPPRGKKYRTAQAAPEPALRHKTPEDVPITSTDNHRVIKDNNGPVSSENWWEGEQIAAISPRDYAKKAEQYSKMYGKVNVSTIEGAETIEEKLTRVYVDLAAKGLVTNEEEFTSVLSTLEKKRANEGVEVPPRVRKRQSMFAASLDKGLTTPRRDKRKEKAAPEEELQPMKNDIGVPFGKENAIPTSTKIHSISTAAASWDAHSYAYFSTKI